MANIIENLNKKHSEYIKAKADYLRQALKHILEQGNLDNYAKSLNKTEHKIMLSSYIHEKEEILEEKFILEALKKFEDDINRKLLLQGIF